MSVTLSLRNTQFFTTTRTLHSRNLYPYRRNITLPKRRRFISPKASSLVLPLLPFNVNEVLIPSETKTLHLYEARYLALLEESLAGKNIFVHFVLDPIAVSGDSAAELSFAARYGCLVLIENVERLDVGALVTIRGIGRVKLIQFFQAEPYLKGEVIPMRDSASESPSDVLSSDISAVKDAVYSLNSLEIKLKAPKEVRLQTQIVNSLLWADKEPSLDCDDAFIPSLPERISFAAFQPVSGSTESEVIKLQQKKLTVMELRDTKKRLNDSLEFLKENISMVVAKLAIQSIEM